MPPRINGQSLLAASKSSLRKRPLKSISPDLPSSLSISKNPKRALHTTISRKDVETQERPRWEAPPPRMTAPFRSKPPVLGNDFRVNEDPYRLDEAYIRVLGPGGDSMLTDEVKWLAVTHKSFDHGRRGFNDKLAFFGKRIVHLQTSLALLYKPSGLPVYIAPDEFEREPFEHPALETLHKLTPEAKSIISMNKRLAQLAVKYGLDDVIRWKPKQSNNLGGSGYQLVYAQTMFAIAGALALQKGGEVANNMVRERILKPLGLEP